MPGRTSQPRRPNFADASDCTSFAASASLITPAGLPQSANAWPWNNLGNLLQYHLDRYEEAESAYRRAIDLDPSYAWPWIGLGNLYCDALHRFQDADDAFTKAMDSEATRISALLNRIFLQRDFLGDPEAARRLMESVPDDHSAWFHDTFLLHQAVFCAYDQNWGLAAERLEQALDQLHDGLPAYTADDWARTAAVLLHLNYGQPMLSLLEKRGDERRLRPFYEAVRAHVGGDRRLLLNIAVEVRQAAEWIFDQIALRRRWLPESTMAKRE